MSQEVVVHLGPSTQVVVLPEEPATVDVQTGVGDLVVRGLLGALSDLDTADKSSFVAALNWLKSYINGSLGVIGNMADLNVSDVAKATLVQALNEVISQAGGSVDLGPLEAAVLALQQGLADEIDARVDGDAGGGYAGSIHEYPIGYYIGSPFGVYADNAYGGALWEVCIPFPVVRRADGTLPRFDQILAGINTTSVSGSVRLTIRNNVSGIPTALQAEALVSASAAGWTGINLDWQPTEPGLYFLGAVPSDTTIRMVGLNNNDSASVGLPQTGHHRRGFFIDGNPNAAVVGAKATFQPFTGIGGSQSQDAILGPNIQLRVAS